MAVEEDAEGVEVEDKEEEWRWEKTGGEGEVLQALPEDVVKEQQERRG